MVDTVNTENIREKNSEITSRLRTPGEILREARFAENQSDLQIATRLYLSRTVIRFIENDEYDKLPGVAFTRGYLRAYARLVNVSQEEVMAAFDALGLAKEPTPTLAPVTRTRKQVSANDRSIRWLTALIIATLFALVFSWWHNQSDHPIDESALGATAPATDVQTMPVDITERATSNESVAEQSPQSLPEQSHSGDNIEASSDTVDAEIVTKPQKRQQMSPPFLLDEEPKEHELPIVADESPIN